MARTKMLGKHNPETCRYYLNTAIRSAMAEQEIPYAQDLARLMGMSTTALCRRMTGEREWKFSELCRLVEVLKLDLDDVGRIFGTP